MDIYMSESRIMDQELEISRNQEQEISRNQERGISSNQEQEISETQGEILEAENIKPGSKSICHANVQLLFDHQKISTRKVKAKLDSCGSVSIAHSNLLNSIKSSGHYKLPNIRLRGIGGKTNMLQKV